MCLEKLSSNCGTFLLCYFPFLVILHPRSRGLLKKIMRIHSVWWTITCHEQRTTAYTIDYMYTVFIYLYIYTLVLNGPDFEVLSKGLDFCPRDRPLALRPKSRPYGLNMRFELINHFFHKTRIFELHYFHGSKYHLPSTFFSSLGNYILSAGLPCLPWEVDDPKARGWSKLNSTECFSNIFLTITDTTNKLWIHAKGALLRLSVEVPSLFCSIFCPNTEAATSDKRSSLINNSQCGRTPTWCTPLVEFWDGCLSKSFCWMF